MKVFVISDRTFRKKVIITQTVHFLDIRQTRKEHVCHLRIDLVMYLFTERGVEHSVLSELLFEAHLEVKLMAGCKYTQFRDAHCAAKNSTKGNILSKDNSR